MARARNIKPSFFQNEDLADLSPLARLAFIGMWTIADFKGCIEFRPKRLKVQLLPYDECDMEQIAAALDKSGFIRMYSVGESRYLKIIGFERHQNPHKNERDSGSDIPDIQESVIQNNGLQNIQNNPEQNGTAPADSLIPLPDSPILIPDSKTPAAAQPKPKKSKLIPMPDDFVVSERVSAWAIAAGYSSDRVASNFAKFVLWAKAKGATYADWDAALMNAIRDDWAARGASSKASGQQFQTKAERIAANNKAALDEWEREVTGLGTDFIDGDFSHAAN